jgi:hypothetical protein
MGRHRTAACLTPGATTPTRAAVTTAVTAVALLVLAGCSGGEPGLAGSTSPGPTVTVTVTRTVPAPTATTGTTPPTAPTTPPPARDPGPIPTDASDYAEAFVTAWAERDRPRADQLATAAVVKTAFASSVPTAPAAKGCEGAAGSTYCTYEGDEYTMTVRVLNEPASQGQPHAVTEVRFGH